MHPNETERQKAKSSQTYAPPSGAPPTGNSDNKTPAYNAPPSSNVGQSSFPGPQASDQRDSGGKKGLFGKLKDKLNAPPGQGVLSKARLSLAYSKFRLHCRLWRTELRPAEAVWTAAVPTTGIPTRLRCTGLWAADVWPADVRPAAADDGRIRRTATDDGKKTRRIGRRRGCGYGSRWRVVECVCLALTSTSTSVA